MQMSFPETVSDSLCRNSLVMQTDCCSSCPVSDDLGGENAGCGGPGLVWLHVVCGCELDVLPNVLPVGCTAKFSEMLFGDGL